MAKRFTKYINVLVKLAIIILLIVAAATKQQYGFYNFVRWVVLGSFLYFAYKSYINKYIGLFIFFIVTALLFNPFYKFWFQRETWHLIDYIVAGVLILSCMYDLKIVFLKPIKYS